MRDAVRIIQILPTHVQAIDPKRHGSVGGHGRILDHDVRFAGLHVNAEYGAPEAVCGEDVPRRERGEAVDEGGGYEVGDFRYLWRRGCGIGIEGAGAGEVDGPDVPGAVLGDPCGGVIVATGDVEDVGMTFCDSEEGGCVGERLDEIWI